MDVAGATDVLNCSEYIPTEMVSRWSRFLLFEGNPFDKEPLHVSKVASTLSQECVSDGPPGVGDGRGGRDE